jgi:hypothetical protein
LSDGGRYLEPLVKYHFLPLKSDIFRPFNETGKICLRANRLAYNNRQKSESVITMKKDSPIPKFLLFASNRGFFFVLAALAPAAEGAGAGFFPDPGLALGY